MSKKTIYYLVAAVVLVVVVAIIVAMQNQKPANPLNPQTPAQKQAPKTENDLNQKIAEKLNMPENKLPLRVTLDDNGQFYSATPGSNISLMLGTDYEWTISSSDENVLAKRTVDIADARVQGVYQVVGEGNAVLAAQGKCKTGAKCDPASVNFVFNVDGVISENFAPEDLVK